MLDLKAQLLKAGLVTEEQVEKAESDKQAARADKKKGKGKRPPASEEERWERRVEQLKAAPKSEQYDVIRGWVQRTRLDNPKGLPSEEAERFHFAKHDGHITWLTLEPDLKAKLSEGQAAIIAFMSHNGLAHAVAPKDVAEDVAKVRPDWVRHLVGYEVQSRSPEQPSGEPAPPEEPPGGEGPS